MAVLVRHSEHVFALEGVGVLALGAKRSTSSKVSHRVSASLHPRLAAALHAGIKGSGSLESFAPSILDQGSSGACTAHSFSVATVIAIACAASRGTAPSPLGFVPSPRELYAATRAIARAAATPIGAHEQALGDVGAELPDVATAGREYGLKPMQGPTPDGRNSDVWTPLDVGTAIASNVNDEPDVLGLEAGQTRLVDGEYSIAPATADGPELLAASIDAGIPCWAGGFVDSAFMRLGAGDVMGAPNPNDPNGGGHAFVFPAYRTASTGRLEFRLRNSWGLSWADGGSGWVSEDFVRALWELWPFAVALQKAA
jgi:hypothetical protein